MKKVFSLIDEKRHEDRVLDGIKNNIRKYIKREKGKKLPDSNTMYWDFDCKVGATEEDAKVVTQEELIKEIDKIKSTNSTQCYIEILAKTVDKPIKEDTIEPE